MADTIFTIVVADDEAELREAMCRLIQWEDIGFRLVGSAGNGLDALQLVEQLQPDILLTDIQMPFITGTALAQQVRELQPLIQVAFLSGYDDFEYARSAIDNQVISYLLKPISMAELTEALKDIHRRMEDRFSAYSPRSEVKDLSLALASLLLDDTSDRPTEDESLALLEECGMTIPRPYELAVIAISFSGTIPVQQNAAQIIENVLSKHFSCGSIVSGHRCIALLSSGNGFQELGSSLDELLYISNRTFGTESTIGVSRFFSDITQCSAAYREAVDALKISDGPGISRLSISEGELPNNLASEQHNIHQLEAILYSGDRRALTSFLSSFLGSSGDLASMQILMACQNVMRASLGNSITSELLNRFDLSDPVGSGIDRETFRNAISDFCLECQKQLSGSARAGMEHLVNRTIGIIDSRYMEEGLSLNSVSEELHVSPNYLSANMKKYAGDTFINLLIRRRMETARSLVMMNGIKIGEVAEMCGYSDQHYFSFCFKKYYGVSPAKMRHGEGGTQT